MVGVGLAAAAAPAAAAGAGFLIFRSWPHAIGSGLVRDPFLLSLMTSPAVVPFMATLNAFAYGDGVDFDVDDSDSCVFGY